MFTYFKDVRAELNHVSWPSRRTTIMYTIVVLAVSIATAIYLGVLDYILSTLITRIV